MHGIRWISFCISNAVTRTVVHFFPATINVSAAYSATCKLSLFGKGLEKKSVILEGARFGQPDGVRLEEAFPVLQESATGIFGIEVEIQTNQPRVDLTVSSCVVELTSRGHSCRFMPKMIEPPPTAGAARRAASPAPPRAAAAGIKDAFHSSSLITLNACTEPYAPRVFTALPGVQGVEAVSSLAVETLAAGTAQETELGEAFCRNSPPQECSWGLLRSGPLWLPEAAPQEAACFIMYRDAVTRRPVSVSLIS